MAYEDKRTILIRRVHNRLDDVFDIRGSTLAYLSEVVVDDGMISAKVRSQCPEVPVEAFDYLEKVLAEEVQRYDLCQRIGERFSQRFPTETRLLRAMVDEVVDKGEITAGTRKFFELEDQTEAREYLEQIAREELESQSGNQD